MFLTFNSTAYVNYLTISSVNDRGLQSLLRIAGCMQNGVYHASDTEWTEENDPCQIFTCKAGVITKSKLLCYTPCLHPKWVPGQCCPICEGV